MCGRPFASDKSGSILEAAAGSSDQGAASIMFSPFGKEKPFRTSAGKAGSFCCCDNGVAHDAQGKVSENTGEGRASVLALY